MGIDGKFTDVSIKELAHFAEKHEIPYARKSLNEVKRAIAMWQDFAGQAGLSKASTDEIKERLSKYLKAT